MNTRRAHPPPRPLSMAAILLALSCGRAAERPLPDGVTWRPSGHPEIALAKDGTTLPRWFGVDQPIGLCLDVPLELDTSQWRARLRFDGRGADDGFERPRAQAGSTLCFGREPPPDLPSSPRLEVCGTVLDGYDGSRYRLPCFTAVYDADRGRFDARLTAAYGLIGQVDRRREQRVEELDRLAAGLDVEGYPVLALSLRLVILDELRREGTPDALAEVRRRLDRRPAWLTRPAATLPATKVVYEHAMLELAQGRRRRAWQLLAAAEELAGHVAATIRIGIVVRQAEILSRMGSESEPAARLRAALADCARWPCNPRLVPAAHDLLAWLLVIDPDTGPDDLESAAASLDAAGGNGGGGPRARANRHLNAALLATRRGTDATAEVDAARAILSVLEPDAEVRALLAWAGVVEGLAALVAGELDRAIELCRRMAEDAPAPRTAAWAWSCVGRAERRRGELDAAADAFDQALLRHALATPELGRDLPLAPGRRVDDFYRAARLAVELKAPERAWRLLESLDRLAVDPFESCPDRELARRRAQQRQESLLSELARTEPPLAADRRHQLEPVRRSLLYALEEVQRAALRDCRRRRTSPTPARLRAFALDDEVLLLERSEDGRVTVARRTSMVRRELRRRLDEVTAAQRAGRLDDDDWRRLTRPLAAALLPADVTTLSGVTGFALHGVLQRAPLAALPVAAGGERWLAGLTIAVSRPAVIEEPAATATTAAEAAALFVVDPLRDLAGARRSRAAYRRHFPAARLLVGAEATRRTVRSAFVGAAFVHFDAHGVHDPAFPQLSGLLLHDGLLTLADLATGVPPRRFVNLSGCTTAGGTASGGSDGGGLAGALAERAVPWVVASRSALDDRLAGDFNLAFYRRLAAGATVPEAFGAALDRVRERYPAAAWSNLVLLGSGENIRAAGQMTAATD